MTVFAPEEQLFQEGFDAAFSAELIAAQASEGPYPFPVSIDGVGYVMDLAKWAHHTLPQFRPPSDTSQEPGEQSLTAEGIFKRTGFSSYLGAGQQFYDDNDSDRHRFYRSAGIDPWERRGVKLLAGTQLVRASAAGNTTCFRLAGLFWMIEDDHLHHCADPLNPGATWTDQGLSGHQILDYTIDGNVLYLALGAGGILKVTPGSSGGTQMLAGGFTFFPSMIVYANGWLVAGQGNLLKSVAADGTLVDVGNHNNPAFVWTCGTSAPNAIYVGGNAGLDVGEFYKVTVQSSGAALAPPIFAGNVPTGETVNVAHYYSQVVLIGTSKGLRTATLDSQGGMSIGAVIDDGSAEGTECIDARGQFAWFGYVNAFDSAARGLARADLAHDTDDLVPAYAPDLASTVHSGRVTGVGTWTVGAQDSRLFTVSGSGLWAQTDDLCAQGTLDLGSISLASPEQKSIQSVSMAHDQLHGTIDVLLSGADGSSAEYISEQQNTYASGELVRPLIAEMIDVQITLARDTDDPTQGPRLRRWTIRIVPAPPSVDEIIVPILLAESVDEEETGMKVHYDGFSIFRSLKQLENRRVVKYREGQATYLVTVRGVGMDGADNWLPGHRFLKGTLNVRLVTLEGVPPQLPGGSF